MRAIGGRRPSRGGYIGTLADTMRRGHRSTRHPGIEIGAPHSRLSGVLDIGQRVQSHGCNGPGVHAGASMGLQGSGVAGLRVRQVQDLRESCVWACVYDVLNEQKLWSLSSSWCCWRRRAVAEHRAGQSGSDRRQRSAVKGARRPLAVAAYQACT
jgi:hypothetical protein